jgi:hypothetical protein
MSNPIIVLKFWNIEKELQCRCGCGRYNYDDLFLIRLTAFRITYGKALLVTSGCRCIKHNKKVGGVETSLHQCETKKASAIDVSGFDLSKVFNEACSSGLFNEVEWHKNDNKFFVHLGYDKNQKINSFVII